ncbi:snRNA-activating protein complex subunit 5-like [Liolophura sinensis]|uniref:snRNA-activating protein complex subunit 5-like n=1 Tax=Liolophura sinensis TaxID=3198878 RepID=UPI003159828A
MAAFSEIKALQEERKTLLSIASELNAQLQRLKIEELALMSLAKLDEERSRAGEEGYAELTAVAKCQSQGDENTEDNTELETLDLSVTQTQDMQVEEEEEEESEEEPDELTMFMNDLAHRTTQATRWRQRKFVPKTFPEKNGTDAFRTQQLKLQVVWV